MTLKGYRYRIFPTPEQESFLVQQFGSARFIYNFLLANRQINWKEHKLSSSYIKDTKIITELKNLEDYIWLKDAIAQALQASAKNLDTAYQRFFDHISKYPKFHKKKNKQSIKLPQFFSIENNFLHIPKLKSGIRINIHRYIPKKQQSCTITKMPSGKYYASFLCEEEVKPLPKNNNIVGIDLGIKHFAVTSHGEVVDNPKFGKASEHKLKKQQRKLSRKKKGSNRRNKQRIKVAKIHEHIANQRSDFLHKLSKTIVYENQVIIVEDLAVKNMVKNHKLAKSIHDCSWSKAMGLVEYKSKWYGRTFHKVNTFFPSSKTCNYCGNNNNDLTLSDRTWVCSSCGKVLDRDINAAFNIRDQGIKDLQVKLAESGVGTTSDLKQILDISVSSREQVETSSDTTRHVVWLQGSTRQCAKRQNLPLGLLTRETATPLGA